MCESDWCLDIWFHRYENGIDIEGKCEKALSFAISLLTFSIVDYNSWQESEKGLRLAASLDKNVVLAEGMTTFHGNSCTTIFITLL